MTLPWSEELLFNVVRGRWPGGTEGVMCHESRPLEEEEETGSFHSSKGIGHGSLKDFVNPLGGPEQYMKVPYTVAGARVPHLATLSGLRIARRAERHGEASSFSDLWRRRDLDDLGLQDRWVAIVRKNSDEETVERLLRFAVAGGVLTAWRVRPHWQADGPALDQLAADVEELVRRRGMLGG